MLGWRHLTPARKATFLACVIELGETGSSLKPARCDGTTGPGNRPNHFLLGLRAYAAGEARGARGPGGGGGPGKARQGQKLAFSCDSPHKRSSR